jgi:hypothetical protein
VLTIYTSVSNTTTVTYFGKKIQSEAGPPPWNRLSQTSRDTRGKVPWLLGRYSLQLRKSCAVANMVYSRSERVLILEHYFTSKSFAAVREAFSNAYPDKELLNKTTIHRLVTRFRNTGSVYLWQVLIERQNSWNYGCTDFKQCISPTTGYSWMNLILSLALSFCTWRGSFFRSYG